MDICSLLFNPGKETIGASAILIGDETLEMNLQLQMMASVSTRLTGRFVMSALTHDESRLSLPDSGRPMPVKICSTGMPWNSLHPPAGETGARL